MAFSKHIESMGADVEVFLRNKKTNKICSAVGLIGGTKENPRIVPYGNLQEDNVLAEFAIDPAYNKNQFITHLASVMSSLEQAVPHTSLVIESARYMTGSEVASLQAQEFGCDPDWNAWSQIEQLPPDPKNSVSKNGRFLRTAGGHLHFGINGIMDWDIEAKMKLTRALDLFVGLPLRLIDPRTKDRDKLYGGYGHVRFKSYGLEYRTPSNIWIRNEQLVNYVIDQSVEAFDYMFGDKKFASTHVQGDFNALLSPNIDMYFEEQMVRENSVDITPFYGPHGINLVPGYKVKAA